MVYSNCVKLKKKYIDLLLTELNGKSWKNISWFYTIQRGNCTCGFFFLVFFLSCDGRILLVIYILISKIIKMVYYSFHAILTRLLFYYWNSIKWEFLAPALETWLFHGSLKSHWITFHYVFFHWLKLLRHEMIFSLVLWNIYERAVVMFGLKWIKNVYITKF